MLAGLANSMLTLVAFRCCRASAASSSVARLHHPRRRALAAEAGGRYICGLHRGRSLSRVWLGALARRPHRRLRAPWAGDGSSTSTFPSERSRWSWSPATWNLPHRQPSKSPSTGWEPHCGPRLVPAQSRWGASICGDGSCVVVTAHHRAVLRRCRLQRSLHRAGSPGCLIPSSRYDCSATTNASLRRPFIFTGGA